MRIFLRVFSMFFDVKKQGFFARILRRKNALYIILFFGLFLRAKTKGFSPCASARFCYHKIAPLFSAIFARKRTLEKRAQKTRVFTREYTENMRAFYGLIFDEKITAEIHRKKRVFFYIVFCRFF